ncbi:hypothetical protein B7494_g3427 [Chlorociboria aeruginascens]|nr:hypothetical protein B7494_g3427 [Chlorociboria aeruginascens]
MTSTSASGALPNIPHQDLTLDQVIFRSQELLNDTTNFQMEYEIFFFAYLLPHCAQTIDNAELKQTSGKNAYDHLRREQESAATAIETFIKSKGHASVKDWLDALAKDLPADRKEKYQKFIENMKKPLEPNRPAETFDNIIRIIGYFLGGLELGLLSILVVTLNFVTDKVKVFGAKSVLHYAQEFRIRQEIIRPMEAAQQAGVRGANAIANIRRLEAARERAGWQRIRAGRAAAHGGRLLIAQLAIMAVGAIVDNVAAKAAEKSQQVQAQKNLQEAKTTLHELAMYRLYARLHERLLNAQANNTSLIALIASFLQDNNQSAANKTLQNYLDGVIKLEKDISLMSIFITLYNEKDVPRKSLLGEDPTYKQIVEMGKLKAAAGQSEFVLQAKNGGALADNVLLLEKGDLHTGLEEGAEEAGINEEEDEEGELDVVDFEV